MNSCDFFIYEFICFMNSYMNSGVPRFQMLRVSDYRSLSESPAGNLPTTACRRPASTPAPAQASSL